MTNKLTCKMSDGTEWEVRCQWNQLSDPESKIMVVEPIKREPREGWIALNEDDKLYSSKEEALEKGTKYRMGCFEIIKVREVE